MRLTSCEPVRTALRMLMEGGRESGWGEGGADMLVVWEEHEAWSSDRYTDLGESSFSREGRYVIWDFIWDIGDLGFFLCFLYLCCNDYGK